MTDAALRSYLLGKLTESEVDLVETRLLEDEDLFALMQTAEDDLFDAFARNRLDADERTRFLQRFGADASRRQFARAFVQRTPASRVIPFVQRRWVELAVAATLAIVVGALVIPRGSRTDQPPLRTEVAPPTPTPKAPVISTVSLTLATSRAAGGAQRVLVNNDATEIDLRVRVNPADRYAFYAIEVRSNADQIVWGGRADMTSENGELIVHANVPAARMPPGSYEVAVRGGAAAQSLDDLGFIAIEVTRER